MMAEFRHPPDKHDTYDLIIYNTGDGIQFHPVCQKKGPFKRQPFVEFVGLEVETLGAFMDAFLGSRLNPGSDGYNLN